MDTSLSSFSYEKYSLAFKIKINILKTIKFVTLCSYVQPRNCYLTYTNERLKMRYSSFFSYINM